MPSSIYLTPTEFQNNKNTNAVGCYYTCTEDKYKYWWNNQRQCWSLEKQAEKQAEQEKSCKALPTEVSF